MSNEVMTALGLISADDMGITLAHEHLIWGPPGWDFDVDFKYDRDKVVEKLVKQINHVKDTYGLHTIMDATVSDGPRDPELYRIVQEKTGVIIICSTGLYNELDGDSAYWKIILANRGDYNGVLQRLYNSYMHELTVGIGNSNVKAGMIKLATHKGKITRFEEMSFEAGAMAQKATGVPIITHTEGSTMGPEQADFLISKGADPKRIAIGHMCDTSDFDYITDVLKRGVFINMDRFGLNFIYPDQSKCENVVKLVEMGYLDRILMGHDSLLNFFGWPAMSEEQLKAFPNWNLEGIFGTFIPILKKLGLTDKHIKTIMVDNPRRLFVGK